MVTWAANSHLHLERVLRIDAERRNHTTRMAAFTIDHIELTRVVPVDEKRVERAVGKWFRIGSHWIQAETYGAPVLLQGGEIADAHFEHIILLAWQRIAVGKQIPLPKFPGDHGGCCAERDEFDEPAARDLHEWIVAVRSDINLHP